MRHVLPSPDGSDGGWTAWIEAALLVRAEIPAWDHVEETWVHWAFRPAAEGAPAGPAPSNDPAVRAAVPGAPAIEGQARPATAIDEAAARELVAGHLARWRPAVHRQRDLGIVSRLGEPRETFRKRCLSPLRPLLRAGAGAIAQAELAARLVALASGIETIQLGADSLELRCARMAVVWHPEGAGPASAPPDVMATGAAKEKR